MAEVRAQRRLAAILVADVVGYSRLMEEDEAGTLAALKERRKVVVEPLVAEYAGRVVKFLGDGVLIDFSSAVNSVACALSIQRRMAQMNEPLPDARRILLRIGINLGELVIESRDVYGDGVNIAARLEGLSDPGGACISAKVHEEVRGKLEFDAEDIGEVQLKNISRPVRAYRIRASEFPKALSSARSGVPGHLISVAVLPFTNMSNDPAQDYFVDGITEDLITALAKSRFLSVVARNSTFQFKNRSVDVQAVGRQLGARFVLEGSVRIGGTRVRATAQLIETESGTHKWAERYDRELSDIFALQDEIVGAISGQLAYDLIDAAVATRRNTPTASLTAYDRVLRGRAAWRRGAVIETHDQYLKAIEADGNYAAALASLAFIYAEDISMQMLDKPVDELAKQAQHYVERAISADDGDSYAQHMIGTTLLCLGELDRAKQHLELAITLNPHFPSSTINVGCTIAFMGAHREGLAIIERVFMLEPRLPPAMRAVPFYVHCIAGDADAALADLARIESPLPFLHLMMGGCLHVAGRDEEGRAHVAAFQAKRSPAYDVAGFARWFARYLRLPEDRARFLAGLRKAGFDV